MRNEVEILNDLILNTRQAQKEFYENYSPVFRGICLRYAKTPDDVEDLMHEGFIKIFQNIKKFDRKGSLEGWAKRIIISTSIDAYRKNKKIFGFEKLSKIHEKNISDEQTNQEDEINSKNDIEKTDFSSEEIIEVINSLPEGYRLVFNLYAVENYKHKDISTMLGIDVSTSKSQLSRARKLMQQKLRQIASEKQHEKKEEKKKVWVALNIIFIMPNNLEYIDQIVRSKLTSYSVPNAPGSWEILESKMGNLSSVSSGTFFLTKISSNAISWMSTKIYYLLVAGGIITIGSIVASQMKTNDSKAKVSISSIQPILETDKSQSLDNKTVKQNYNFVIKEQSQNITLVQNTSKNMLVQPNILKEEQKQDNSVQTDSANMENSIITNAVVYDTVKHIQKKKIFKMKK